MKVDDDLKLPGTKELGKNNEKLKRRLKTKSQLVLKSLKMILSPKLS